MIRYAAGMQSRYEESYTNAQGFAVEAMYPAAVPDPQSNFVRKLQCAVAGSKMSTKLKRREDLQSTNGEMN